MNWQGKRVLVTGAGGFIGSHLTERLVAEGADVRALVHYNALGSRGWLNESTVTDQVDVVAGDIADCESVRSAMKDREVAFHLAALIAIPYSYQAPRSYVRTNVEGTLNVMQAARELGVERVAHTSTSEVYGTAQRVPIDEEHPLQGQSPYSASKIGADKIAEAFYRSFDVPVVTVRPFNTYGPRQSARAVVPTVITQALACEKLRLGNLHPTRDLNFVADTVEGFLQLAACDNAVGEVVNIGTGKEISIGELVRTILDILGRDVPVEVEQQRLRPEQSEVDRLCASNEKLKGLTGWEPRCTLREGLEKTIQWIEKNIERYRPGSYTV